MLQDLAQNISIPTKERIEQILSSHPIDWEQLADRVAQLPLAYIASLLVLGFALLIAGYKIYRIALVFTGIAGGAILGVSIARWLNWNPLITAGVSAAILGLLAIPLQRALFFFGGGAIGVLFVAPSLAILFQGLGPRFWALWLLLGFVVVGGLAVLFFKQIVVLATSVEGAIIITFGCAILAQGRATLQARSVILHPPLVLLIVVLLLSIFGVTMQAALEQKKELPPTESATAKSEK